MYPNIVLSNRFQPDSVVDEATCAVCDFNRLGKTCDPRMTWAWGGEYFPARRDEFNVSEHALNHETILLKKPGGRSGRPSTLRRRSKPRCCTSALGTSRGGFTRRSNRRYEYEGLHKTCKKNLDAYTGEHRSIAEVDVAKKMIVLCDLLQLAHKCSLKSLYGYVVRKGARALAQDGDGGHKCASRG